LNAIQEATQHNDLSQQRVTSSGSGRCTNGCTSEGNAAKGDPDLAQIVAVWPDLPEAIRRAVLALVGSAGK
jgi:hypothetical protein